MRTSGKISRLMMLCASLALVVPAQANLITNGSFEQGIDTGPEFVTLWAGEDDWSITGWTVSAGSVDYIGGYWQAAHGSRSLDLNGLSMGTIFQEFPTIPGVRYVVRFALAGNPDSQPRRTLMRVWADDPDVTYADFLYRVNGQTRTDMGWVYRAWAFTAASTSTTLGFTSLDQSGFYGPALDDVSVGVVPEPGSLALLGLGLTAAAWLRRRK